VHKRTFRSANVLPLHIFLDVDYNTVSVSAIDLTTW